MKIKYQDKTVYVKVDKFEWDMAMVKHGGVYGALGWYMQHPLCPPKDKKMLRELLEWDYFKGGDLGDIGDQE